MKMPLFSSSGYEIMMILCADQNSAAQKPSIAPDAMTNGAFPVWLKQRKEAM
jgi:hypothetical protein